MEINNYLSLERPHRKVEVAFLMSMKMLYESSKNTYFWTLTPAWAMGDNAFSRVIRRVLRKWAYRGYPVGFRAIRVFEPFKSGYLHCHFVTNTRIGVREMRRICEGTGIGRIDVRRCNTGVADYLCKYLRKDNRLPGLRTWAKWGKWEHVRVNNVEIDSQETRLMKWCRMMTDHETRCTFSMQTGEIFRHHVKKPKSQAWVDARVMFNKEMVRFLKDRNPRMLTERDGRFWENNG